MSSKWERINIFFSEEELNEKIPNQDKFFYPLEAIKDPYLKAIAIIGRVYAESLDYSGNLQTGHLWRVSECLETEEEKIVGLLHDVVEDEKCTLNDLYNLGFFEKIVEAIAILTRDKKKFPNYKDYIQSIIESRNLIALRVKFWDMEDNQSPIRINDLPPRRKQKSSTKYKPHIPQVVISIKEIEYTRKFENQHNK